MRHLILCHTPPVTQLLIVCVCVCVCVCVSVCMCVCNETEAEGGRHHVDNLAPKRQVGSIKVPQAALAVLFSL